MEFSNTVTRTTKKYMYSLLTKLDSKKKKLSKKYIKKLTDLKQKKNCYPHHAM